MPDSLLSRVIDANGTVVVEYTYDAWGKVLNVTGDENLKDTLGEIQPFHYRGYVYDVLSGSLMFFFQDRIANGFHITAGDFEYHSFTYHVETTIYNEKMIYSIRIYSYSKETVMEFRMQYMSSGPYWFPSYQYDMIIIGGENGV